ncbi:MULTISPECIES: nucleoside hydrolase [unclassified Lactobacillus]|uniref:nucleoside hydrolase n=1 Tax=unclassified Lactobacillus TaxID=2620435 RepID=UPI000EFD30BC|nr:MULTISPECIES: nucleoside hydrolase [unclassified Lactobacillus]RMC24868.1 nucleoside hydrolase [Lactobacillus sp. ESL0247]RMC29022.1 nucleoside hydrolase [Lactobacillus sp. ESL0246]RMC32625.1 nucleoside hydrolase [Lactobacillus sp. ESL0245]
MTKKPVIISTDPGIDDVVAITIALFSGELDVKLIAATWGNVPLDKTLNNTLKLETFLKTNVPVVSGASRPLLRNLIDASDVHGKSGMDGYDFPEPDTSLLQSKLAAEAIHEVVANSQEKVTLVQIGPATDYALYFRQYPEDLSRIDQLVIMGGAIGRGNWGPYSEYNVAGDPEAAQIVFSSNVKILLAPLELGHQAFVTQTTMEKVKKLGRAGDMLYHLLSKLNDKTETNGREIYDALAVGMLLKPQMYEFKPAYVVVDTKSPNAYGASVIDFDKFFNKPANAQVGVQVDQVAFAEWLIDAIRKVK